MREGSRSAIFLLKVYCRVALFFITRQFLCCTAAVDAVLWLEIYSDNWLYLPYIVI